MGRYKIDWERESELWDDYKTSVNGSNLETRNRLVEFYLPIVESIASHTHSQLATIHEISDFVSWGVFGLIESIERFDRTKGVKFTSYCPRRIRGAIMDEIRRGDVLSRWMRQRISALEKFQQDTLYELGS